MLATKEGGYEVLVAVAGMGLKHVQVREAAIFALSCLLDGNPDPLDESGFELISETLEISADASKTSLAAATLSLMLNCCVRHERNRQNFVSHLSYITMSGNIKSPIELFASNIEVRHPLLEKMRVE